MRWWDDLWLNESFADFISYYCLQEINSQLVSKYDDAMAYFRDRKRWCYMEDKRNSTTHPIRDEVSSTQMTNTIFDGITYAKGGSTLKQVMFLMGSQNFSKSLGEYFHRFEWENATIDDFLDSLSNNFKSEGGFTLQHWKKEWLEAPSLNNFELKWEPS